MKKLTQIQENVELLKQGWNEHIESTKENKNNLKPIQFNNNLISNFEANDKESQMKKRKDNRYQKTIQINGVRKFVYGKTLEEVNKKYKLLTKKKSFNEKSKKNYTLEDWINKWLILYKKPFLNERTYKDAESYMKRIITEFKNKNLTSITSINIQNYYNSIKTSRTKERLFGYFNECLKKAYNLKLIKENPFNFIDKDKKINNKKNAFTIEEQTLILNNANEKIKFLVLFYLITGTRRNEALNIEKKNIDFINNKIYINGTKTENSKRNIFISEDFKLLIKNYLKDKNKLFDIQPDYITKNFSILLKELNIKGSVHSLRHTYATNINVLTSNIKFIQSQLGHSRAETTLNIYTDFDPNLTKENLNKLYNNLYFIK